MIEWCGVCLQDGTKVIGSSVIESVPLCKGCVIAYGQEKEVLRDARQFLRDLDSEPEPAKDNPFFMEAHPPPPVKHLCLCGCGVAVMKGEEYIAGHTAQTVVPPPQNYPRHRESDKPLPRGTCEKCGKDFPIKDGNSGRFCGRPCYEDKSIVKRKSDGSLVALMVNAPRRRKAVLMKAAPQEIIPGKSLCACGCGGALPGFKHKFICGHKSNGALIPARPAKMTVDRSVTHREIVTTEPMPQSREIQQGRVQTILVPGAKLMHHVRITPEIANAVWKSLSMEEKFKIFDVDSMWEAYDDWMRTCLISKVLLVSPDDIPAPPQVKK